MTDTEFKIFENRVRRAAQRQGYRLEKSRRRDPRAVDYGRYWLIDTDTRGAAVGGEFGAVISEVAAWLWGDE